MLVSVLADRVYLVDPENGAWSVVAAGLSDFQAGYAAWAPNHRAFAYGDGGVHVVDTGNRGSHSLVTHAGLSMPAWSPDGGEIAYGDGRNLWVSPAGRLEARYLELPLTLAPLAMDWGPGPAIAFQGLELECRVPQGCSSTERSDVWSILPDGSGLSRLTRTGHAEAPKWSPDGSRVLYLERPDPSQRGAELWVARSDGSDPRRLTDAADVVAADWSPDGDRLALVRLGEDFGELQLWLAGASGLDVRPVGAPFSGLNATVDW